MSLHDKLAAELKAAMLARDADRLSTLRLLKSALGYDDALDTFGVHAVGGTMGAILTGMLARNSANANLAPSGSQFVSTMAITGIFRRRAS